MRVPRWCPEHVVFTAPTTWLISFCQTTRSAQVSDHGASNFLKKFRDNEDPELRKISGKNIETLGKEEILKELEKCGVNGVELCALGAIDPRQENLAVLLHYALDVKETQSPGTSKETEGEPPAKRQKASTEKSEVSSQICLPFN